MIGRAAFTGRRLLAAILLLLALAGTSSAQTPGEAPSAQPLVVGTRLITPFVMKNGEAYSGFSVELWRSIARELGRPFEFRPEPNVRALIERIAAREVDLGIAAISITSEREQMIDFTQPMFESGLQILIRSEAAGGTPMRNMWNFLSSPGFVELVVVLLILVFVPLPIIWLVERPKGSQMIEASTRVGAFFKSIWWTTTTLIGQGTDTPMSVAGRIVALLWMFVGLVFVSYFTGNVTAALTVQRLTTAISSPDDLRGKAVVTVRGSTAATFLNQRGIAPLEVDAVEEAFDSLEKGRVEAMVFDSPVLMYRAANARGPALQLAGPVFRPESYGIAVPLESPLRESINRALLRIKESGEYDEIYRRWFGRSLESGGT
jgi:polar amino acid transport system substrate-binding protein